MCLYYLIGMRRFVWQIAYIFSRIFFSLFPIQKTSDLTIEVKGQPIYVHKAILKIRCSYFRNMFTPNWTENNQR